MHSIEHAYQLGFEDGFRAAIHQSYSSQPIGRMAVDPSVSPAVREALDPSRLAMRLPEISKRQKKRKASAYNKRLGKAIKDLTKRHKLKSGKWKKGWNQKRMMKAAHKIAKR